MSKDRLGWPDLLLVIAYGPVLTGHFFVTGVIVAVWAALYYHYAIRQAR